MAASRCFRSSPGQSRSPSGHSGCHPFWCPRRCGLLRSFRIRVYCCRLMSTLIRLRSKLSTDQLSLWWRQVGVLEGVFDLVSGQYFALFVEDDQCESCLLYTSDAADDLTRVDLGGR